MEFHVAQLLREPVGSRRDYQVAEQCASDPPFPVEGVVSLLRTDAGILATATLVSAVDATCSRCLAPACVPVQIMLEEEYYPTVDVVSGALLPLSDEPTPFIIDKHHILDLCEAARQQLIVTEPMQPLCQEDCAGLCPSCGQDRNRGPCACTAGAVDPRWGALDELLRQSD